MIRYHNLLDLLNKREIKKEEFRKRLNISSATMAKFSKNEYVSMEVIDKICNILKCQPNDIMEYIEIRNGTDTKNGKKYIIVEKPILYDETEKEIFEADDYEEINSDI